MFVVVLEQFYRHHDIVNISEDESTLLRVFILLLEKGYWMFAPVSSGIEMMRRVVAIIETVTVALQDLVSPSAEQGEMEFDLLQRLSM
jgi:hypothetical protein